MKVCKHRGKCNSEQQGDTGEQGLRSIQGLAPSRVSGFKSRLRHHPSLPAPIKGFQRFSPVIEPLLRVIFVDRFARLQPLSADGIPVGHPPSSL